LRLFRSRKKWSAVLAGVGVFATFVTVGLATHTPFNFTTTPLATGNLVDDVKQNSDRVKFRRQQRLASPPGHRDRDCGVGFGDLHPFRLHL
jgi:hypothetical protein